MRVLPLCLLALLLAGCSKPKPVPPPTDSVNVPVAPAPVKAAPPARPAPVTLYKNAEALIGKPFRDLGEVSGSVCQLTARDPAPSLASARRRMQQRAAHMKANAVLLHDCQMIRGVAGCYQQAICQGSALNVSAK
ncbi:MULTISPECIES: Rcs stress response system protein RcsF [unclassified Serratia (in: enterobacteria)]|uniref:Rcs stress response system protein RcsF n=1 Tax=unclassified Serratia (in: enterobacteria) TaxID=2647522 RepID=UPI000505DB0B|nr:MULTISPECIES: Rcs stress response system protein RcsF [unclassified Serratia (in: enterobacteria)]KFK92451.1 membrane protein [Serratia sp. Ag2]KFK98455.1 membrane protein [Serratia sp. Ag1]